MGFLAPAERVVGLAIAEAMTPKPPPDITRWCEANIVFDERSPMSGPFNIERFAFLREIHAVLSPEHPCREVTIRGSAQIGKTVSIIQPVLGAWHEYTPLDSLVVHPTTSAASEWVDNKWMPMRRATAGLRAIFGDGRGGDQRDAKFNQETLARNGSLKVASSGSPADLTGTSRRLVIMDDLSKYEMTDKGDPESLAESRASGFEDAKLLRVSTPMIKGTCRISRAYARSDQRLFHLPCPHCGTFAPLSWENFVANIEPERLHAAHFTCESCGGVIWHSHKEAMVRAGRWVAHNPGGDHPGFHLWRAYAPQRDWASIAVDFARVMGWTRIEATTTTEAVKASVEAETEQTFWNDVLGLPYEQASDAPNWEALRDRTENEAEAGGEVLGLGIVPAAGVLLCVGVDCQDDRIEAQILAFGRNRRRWVVDHLVIPHHIGTDEGRVALNALLKAGWRTELGLRLTIDGLAIDGGTYTDDVWDWARSHPWTRVIVVKGASTQNGPVMVPMKFERRKDGHAKRRQKRGFMLNVSMLKGNLYGWLKQEDPAQRGYCRFARGLGDEYYRQLTSEVRVLVRSRTGVVTSRWDLVEPGRRNEVLDTMIYAEAAALRKGWASMTDDQWDLLESERSQMPAVPQGDLFDAAVPVVASKPADPEPAATAPAATARSDDAQARAVRKDWMGPRARMKRWF